MKQFENRPAHIRLTGLAAASGAIFIALTMGAAAQSLAAPPAGAGVAAPEALTAPPTVAMPPDASQPPAQAAPVSSCDQEMMKYQQKRGAQLQSINALVGGKKKQIDPIAACPKFRGLVAIENEMKAWVIKNKDWCSIPDQFIESMKAGFSKTPVFAQKACAAAAMAKRGGGPGGPGGPIAAQPAVKLPSGPL